jgi:hypothetical protein
VHDRAVRPSWKRALLRPPLSVIAAPAYDATIRAALALERARDRMAEPMRGDVSDATVLVKTFERPHIARRLIDSVRRLYPSLRVLIVDDSRTPLDDPRAELLALPYDVGLSAGRNAALAHIDTPFFVLCDDDFVFFRKTNLAPVLARMRAAPELDIVAGQRIDLPIYRSVEKSPEVGTIAGLSKREVVPNFFVGRTASVRRVGWDPELKLVEHADFFERARGVLGVALDPALAVLHAQTPFDAPYMAKRTDVARYHALLKLKRARR